jgi:diguanylate cyclase (GGDEF)-like protein
MVILLFFLTLQSRQVSTDALTGLNNRRWLYRFLEKRLASASTTEPVVLFMMDIDRFTMVNDAYGHIEGDDALRSFATALRLTAARYDAYIARWGGDEFCLIVNSFGRDPEDIEHDIDATLRTAQSVIRVETKPYTLSYRMGFAICDHPETRIDAFVERAIDVMSENKPTRPPSMAE